MKSFRLLGMCVLVGVLSTSSFANAKDEAAIKALYTKLIAAMKKKDVEGIFKLGTSNFSYTAKNGQTMTGKPLKDMMKANYAPITKITNTSHKYNYIKVSGTMAYVDSTLTMKATVPGQGGKSSVMDVMSRSIDTLIKTKSGWLFVKVTEKDSSVKVDGKPVNMG